MFSFFAVSFIFFLFFIFYIYLFIYFYKYIYCNPCKKIHAPQSSAASSHFSPSSNILISCLSLALSRQKCHTLVELVLRISETPILSSSSTLPSVSTFSFASWIQIVFAFSDFVAWCFSVFVRNYCWWPFPSFRQVWESCWCLHPQGSKVSLCLSCFPFPFALQLCDSGVGLTYALWYFVGPVIPEVLHLFGISMLMRPKRQWRSLMVPFFPTLSNEKYDVTLVLLVSFLSGRNVDGREIMVQFAKYGPNAERMWVQPDFCFIFDLNTWMTNC